MDRPNRRGDERRPRYEDSRPQKSQAERDRSRSPTTRDRRDDRRRDRSPPPKGPRSQPRQNGRDRDGHRGRDQPDIPGNPPRGPSGRQPRQDAPPNNFAPRGPASMKQDTSNKDVQMQNSAALEDEDSETEMQRVMGFKTFKTTKNTKVPGNDKNYAIHKVKKAEYRQYMNRVGGFNRPLSPSRV